MIHVEVRLPLDSFELDVSLELSEPVTALFGPSGVGKTSFLETVGRIAMADPEAVPAGVYARLYLESRGLWPSLRAKVIPTLDVRGALAAVASGNVEAGFVYRTDAAIEDRVQVIYTVPRDEGPAILYALGMLEGRDRTEVRQLYEFLGSKAAGDVFARFGFVPLTGGP